MNLLQTIVAFIARLFLSSFFLITGVNKIIYWEEAERRFMHILSDWQAYAVAIEGMQFFLNEAMAWVPVLLIASASLEILGGLLLLFGVKEKLGAVLLILYLVPAAIFLHPFWFLHAMDQEVAMSFFMRDLSILGGLLLVLLKGAHREGTPSFEDDQMSRFG
jgi:uncharacterized membrane protein YphA (DoxX/SURF4 family)